MDSQQTISILNELIRAEQAGIAPRLLESTVFVSRASVQVSDLVHRITRCGTENFETLSKLVIARGGSPALRGGDLRSADLHFQEISSTLPRLVEGETSLVFKYEQAANHLTHDAELTSIVTRLGEGHRDALGDAQRFLKADSG